MVVCLSLPTVWLFLDVFGWFMFIGDGVSDSFRMLSALWLDVGCCHVSSGLTNEHWRNSIWSAWILSTKHGLAGWTAGGS